MEQYVKQFIEKNNGIQVSNKLPNFIWKFCDCCGEKIGHKIFYYESPVTDIIYQLCPECVNKIEQMG